MRLLKVLSAGIFLVFLASCGGGGSSSGFDAPPTPTVTIQGGGIKGPLEDATVFLAELVENGGAIEIGEQISVIAVQTGSDAQVTVSVPSSASLLRVCVSHDLIHRFSIVLLPTPDTSSTNRWV